jgi:predicted ArsR family transcriptional regulator
MSDPLSTLDPILHQPARTQLIAYLASQGETTFSKLKCILGLTDGNLDAHLKKLVDARYLTLRKETGMGRPETIFSLTSTGREALAAYISQLTILLKPETAPEINLLLPKISPSSK